MDERYDEKNQGTWANDAQMPDILKDGNILAKETAKKEQAEVLGKWLWILFWLIIPSAIAGILSNENLFGKESGIYIFGTLLSMVVGILYGVILLPMRGVEEKYRIAGIFSILAAVLSMGLEVIQVESPLMVLVIGLPTLILGLIAKYYEFHSHAAVLREFDLEFSQKWLTLWKWYCVIIAGMIVSTLVVLISFLLAALLILAFTIGTAVIAIVQLVYLYKMAKLFRQYA